MDALALVSGWAAATEVPAALRGPTLLAATGRVPDAGRRPVGQGDVALLRLRREWFGDELLLAGSCPECAEPLELTLGAAALLSVPSAVETRRTVQLDDVVVTARAVTPGDLVSAAAAATTSEAAAMLFALCARATRAGEPVEPLPVDLWPRVAALLAELDPQADLEVDLSCAACASTWTEPLDLGGVLWSELSTHARGLLYDVHRLASSYGWSQQAVLELPAPVRSAYLELVP